MSWITGTIIVILSLLWVVAVLIERATMDKDKKLRR